LESKPRRRAGTIIRSFEDAERFLATRVNFELSKPSLIDPDGFKLDRMRALLALLDEPQCGFPSVHIAGSKGKGSTCEMLTSALSECGYAVGLFTSPHLVSVRERIRIGRSLISETDFAMMAERCRRAVEQLDPSLGDATYFEIVTAMAFLYFAHLAVDVAVIEVGLGGRLDCTNVILPIACGITAIQLEHTAILGDTLEKIAREKAGIFKPGVAVVTVPQEQEVMRALEDVAGTMGSPLAVLGDSLDYSCRIESEAHLGRHARICVTTERVMYEHIAVPLRGEHQAANCGLVLGLLDQLAGRGFVVPEQHVAMGLARTNLAGRMELAWQQPRILLDVAHTPDSLRCLVHAVGSHLRFDSLVMIFGCCADKAVGEMLAEIGRGADKVIFTRVSDNPRAVEPEVLRQKFSEIKGTMSQIAPDLKSAINMASRAVGRDDLILVTGSCYLVGEAKRLLAEKVARDAQTAAGSAQP
jgi:dihydrofolate synthase/folylpolyglutamate synthase